MKSLINQAQVLYILTFFISLSIALLSTPIFRKIAIRFGIMDCPHSNIKTHKNPTPYLGGLSIWLGWALSLSIIRLFTNFPTGTLRSLRGVLVGSIIMLMLGFIDDILPRGLNFRQKFAI
jgi:UDP-GlcNAc:undecaprenyl-phosphate/decaprenyl-phosphate GlcNAc-1-phosphate transferase